MSEQFKTQVWQARFMWILRLAIGWHFLYEGVSKILIPDWSSAPYLLNSRWIFSGTFHWIASHASVLVVVDWMNIIGLTLIGLALILGIQTRLASVSGILLLLLYYAANPPFVGVDFGIPSEGHYLFINKNVVEMMALLVMLVMPASSLPGLSRLIRHMKGKRRQLSSEVQPRSTQQLERRDLLKNLVSVPLLGIFAAGAVKKYQWESVNSITGASIQVSNTQLKDLKGELPKGKIKGFEISRVILGGNLVGGWAHARDLLYVSHLFKSYNTEKKVFDTLELAEMAGINTMNITGIQFPMINKYKRIYRSKLQTICQVHPTKDNIKGDIDNAIDNGVDLIQIQGNCCDFRVRDNEVDVLVEAIDYIKEQGFPAGLGAHSIQAMMAADEAGIIPDFYMKTLHHDQYWSAHPRENRVPFEVDGDLSLDHNKFHDNMFCLFPDESIDFMKKKNIPWIAFKVLAGGAIHPTDGFEFAFMNGSDFICVGMFDWQIVDDVNIALEILPKVQTRERSWMAS